MAHRGSHIAMAEQLLNRADGLTSLQQMRGLTWPQASVAEPLGMAEAVAAGRIGDTGGQHGSAHRVLDQGGSRWSRPSYRHSGLSSPGHGAVAPCPSLPPDRSDGSCALASTCAGARAYKKSVPVGLAGRCAYGLVRGNRT